MQKRILVVDDSEIMRSLLKRHLLFPVCQTDTADCGGRALQLVQTNTYDVIITDFHIPDMQEAELIKKLTKQYPEIPLIVMSGGLTGNEDKLARLGVYKFFEKPIDVKELKKAITRILYC
ncbi:MAG: response regulator [Spirochaetales bacterium]|nr:response regulator [Spirochaetales bacterium]